MQDSSPLVSVIVPVYNTEHFLDECVASIARQTYTNIEIILVDDASSDSSSDYCDVWGRRDERVIVIHLSKGEGASGARNAGLDRAHGDYIMLVDSDDVLDGDAIAYAVDIAVERDYGMVIFGKKYIDETGRETSEYVIDADVAATADSPDYYARLAYLLRNDYLNPPWGKLYARGIVEGKSFDTSMCYEEDLVFVLAALKRTPNVYASSRALYRYRHMDSGMASVFREEKSRNVVRANRRKLEFFGAHLDDPRVMEDLAFHMANDIGWVIPMIRRGLGITAAQKADYVMEMTSDAVMRPYVLKGLAHSWMPRSQKMLIALNWRWLWKLVLR